MRRVTTAEIYVITCAVTSKVYVGSAKNSKVRIRDHWNSLEKGKHENSYLQRAWNKYGAEEFSARVVEKCPLTDRWVKEQWWIDHFCACDRKFGFNAMHSVVGLAPCEGMSKKLKALWQAKWKDPVYKRQRTEELRNLVNKPGVRDKMRASKLESWQNPEYRALQTKKHREWAAKDENKAKLKSQTKLLWQDPIYRAKQLAERKARFKDPAFRAKLSAAALNRRPRAKWIKDSTHNDIV